MGITQQPKSTIIQDAAGDLADVQMADGSNGLTTITPGHVSTTNSTSATLGGGATFTGTGEEVVNHGIVLVSVFSDAASATDGLSVQFSSDNSNWDHTDTFTIAASTGKTFSFQTVAQYMRVVYTNGAGAQSTFRLQTILKPQYVKPSSHRIADTISSQDDAELQKAVLTAQNPAGSFINIEADSGGRLLTTGAQDGLAIAAGDVSGTTFVHKFGNAPDFDTADNEVTIWGGAEDGTAWENMVYDYSSSADIDSISSSSGADTQEITIIGLDTNWDIVEQTATLNGQTRAALGTSLIRVFRAYNSNSTDLAGHVVVYPNTALTAGIPTDKSKIRVVIDPDNQQTLMAIYSIPDGKTGYLRDWYGSIAGANKSSNYIIRLKVREFGKVFRTKHISALSDDGTSSYKHTFVEPEVFAAKTDIELTVQMTAAGGSVASVSGGFDIVLIDD